MNLPVAQDSLGINLHKQKQALLRKSQDVVYDPYQWLFGYASLSPSNKIGASKARASRIRCILIVFGGCLESRPNYKGKNICALFCYFRQ